MAPRAFLPTDTVDSFRFLLQQFEREITDVFSDIKEVFAVIGVFYAAKKTITVAGTILDAVRVHLLPEKRIDWVEKFGPWAVVTGSSEGIGHAYAYELAKRGLNVVLISRSESKLLKAKADIELDCKVKVEYIVADFSSENQTQLYSNIAEKLSDKQIGLLVNNVGVMYDYPDVLLNISQQKLWQLIYVNIGAATMMTYMLLPEMVKRKKGGVVVVSSGSSTHISPQMTVYSATKRYLDYFIHGLAYEYGQSGVTFQCLIPFYTATRMTGYSERLSKTRFLIPNAEAYARSAVCTLTKSSCTTGYFPHTLQLWISKSLPSWVWMWASNKLNSSLRREALTRLSKKLPKSESGVMER
ncbi:inactive hydroxysteroid dehydrogenase-like protein 1 [Physella acuta]|uniref:inactive hydroxysteroid dehydrogenase-like protein 1 n=1 Tax=Physella acuta TaxID=109671 RepID=UPI0027DC9BB5|nr:inactive hydroxysteroid dehydrogenase-like protein 1 [Physella acuta]